MRNLLKIFLSVILLICLFDMPYGYYQFVRFISLVGFGYLAYDYYKTNQQQLAYAFGILALLFQPFVKIALGRALWNVIDVIIAIFLLVLIFVKKK